jgi:hypothetical protein
MWSLCRTAAVQYGAAHVRSRCRRKRADAEGKKRERDSMAISCPDVGWVNSRRDITRVSLRIVLRTFGGGPVEPSSCTFSPWTRERRMRRRTGPAGTGPAPSITAVP